MDIIDLAIELDIEKKLRTRASEAHAQALQQLNTLSIDLQRLPRYRSAGYGAMTEDDDGKYLRVDEVVACLSRYVQTD